MVMWVQRDEVWPTMQTQNIVTVITVKHHHHQGMDVRTKYATMSHCLFVVIGVPPLVSSEGRHACYQAIIFPLTVHGVICLALFFSGAPPYPLISCSQVSQSRVARKVKRQ